MFHDSTSLNHNFDISYCDGSSMFPGFEVRLVQELEKISDGKVQVVATQGSSPAAWIGGSILAGQSVFDSFWVTNEEYDELE